MTIEYEESLRIHAKNIELRKKKDGKNDKKVEETPAANVAPVNTNITTGTLLEFRNSSI